jgi:hypothetical protein
MHVQLMLGHGVELILVHKKKKRGVFFAAGSLDALFFFRLAAF